MPLSSLTGLVVVAASAYDAACAARDQADRMARERDDVIFEVTKKLRDAWEILNAYEDRIAAMATDDDA